MTGAKNINPSLQHHEDWPARVQMTISAVRLETIRRQTKTNTPWVLCKFRIKTVKSLRSLAIRRMGLDIGVFTFTFPFIMPPHLLCCFFRQEQPFQPWRDRYVTKLFGCHFCGNRHNIYFSPSHIWTYHNAYIRYYPCAPSRTTCNSFRTHHSSYSSYRDQTQSF
jgi:hypothetical protein